MEATPDLAVGFAMLTSTDVQYLVGLLSIACNPEDVEIEVGGMVNDVAAQEDRDVDVTITARDGDSTIVAFTGIEVKAEKRPLDVQAVEQLAAKLRDMPVVTRRAIVSASGFTAPAVRKAAHHGVELYQLKDWDEPIRMFGNSVACPNFGASETRWEWIGEPSIRFNPKCDYSEAERTAFRMDLPILDDRGNLLAPARTLTDFGRHLIQNAHSFMRDDLQASFVPGEPKPVQFLIRVVECSWIRLAELLTPVSEVQLAGTLVKLTSSCRVVPKVLVRAGDGLPFAACAVWPVTGGHLVGLAFSNFDRSVRFVTVPVSIRNLKQLRRLRLRGG